MKFGHFRRNFGQNAARLRHLDLAFNGVGTRGAEALAQALVQPTCVLESLNLKCNQIGEDGAEALAEALRTNRMLRSLELAVNSIGNPGGWELADSLEDNETLEHLGLSGNGLDHEGFEFFPSSLQKNSALRSLDVSHNMLADDGAKAVATMLAATEEEGPHARGCMLTSVNIDQNGISDVGAEALATALGRNARLRQLRMRANFVSEVQVAWLKTVASRSMPGVDRVDAMLQKTRPCAKGAPRRKTKAEAAAAKEAERAAERKAYLADRR